MGVLFETHLHTREGSSCATSTIYAQLKACNSRGIRVVAITDHNTLIGQHLYKSQDLDLKFPSLIVIPGVETTVHTLDGEVHLLVYAEHLEDLKLMARNGGFASIEEFESVHDPLKHYVIWAHPGHSSSSVLKQLVPRFIRLKLRSRIRLMPEWMKAIFFNSNKQLSESERKLLSIVNGIEAINGARGDMRHRSPEFFRSGVKEYSLSAGSDTHLTVETGDALTVLEGDPQNAGEVFQLLRAGKFHPLDDENIKLNFY